MWRTHEASIELSEKNVVDGKKLPPNYEDAVERSVDFQNATASLLFEVFGTEITQGWVLYDRPLAGETMADLEAIYLEHARVTINSAKQYKIETVVSWSGMGAADYIACLCQLVQ